MIIAQGARSPDYIIGLTTGEVFCKDKKHLDSLPFGGASKGRLHLFVITHSQHLVHAPEEKSLESMERACAQFDILLRSDTGQMIQKPLYRGILPIWGGISKREKTTPRKSGPFVSILSGRIMLVEFFILPPDSQRVGVGNGFLINYQNCDYDRTVSLSLFVVISSP
jgi:hypothetical protein